MKKADKKKLIIFITIAVMVIVSLVFVFTINKSKKNPSEMIIQLQQLNADLPSLIDQNENLLSSIKNEYQQNQLKEALDHSIELKNSIQQLTDKSLQLTELLKNIVTNLAAIDKNDRVLVEEATQSEIAAMSYLIAYSSFKEVLTQQIGIEYEAQLDKRTLENKADVVEIINQMQKLLKNIKGNLDSANELLKKI